MANIEEMVERYRNEGYSDRNADARVCQDIVYLKDHVNMEKLQGCIRMYIIDEPSLREKGMDDVRKRVSVIFNNRRFRTNVEGSGDRNWLQMDVGEAFKEIQDFLMEINL